MIDISLVDLDRKLHLVRTVTLNNTEHKRCNSLCQYGLLELDEVFVGVDPPIQMSHIIHMNKVREALYSPRD